MAILSFTTLHAGRNTLQKRVMALLRRIKHPTAGNVEAWEDTYAKWEQATKQILNHPKNKVEDGQEWINMTGFLCALGGVCLQQRSTPSLGTYSPPMGPLTERKGSMISMGSCEVNSETSLNRFLERLLGLMVCTHEKVGVQIRTNVKDLVGLELSPALYPMLFTKLRNSIGRFFETQGPVVSQRFPQNSIGAVGSAMFLRFINPAIVSPYEAGILDKKPPPRIERGLKLMS